jgi:RHS repeat-associated protein
VQFSRSLFTGKERDTESGNDYFEARYYNSAMGRFMSPDRPGDQQKEDPQSMNLYSYVRNRPLTSTDPTGRFECKGDSSFCGASEVAAFKLKMASFDIWNPNMYALEKIQDTIGNYGEKNGVVVTSADLGGTERQHEDGNTVGKTITFNSRFLGSTDEMAAILAHEGTHVMQNEIADSFEKGGWGWLCWSCLTPTKPSWEGRKKMESEAYRNQGYMEQALHMKGQIYDPTDHRPGADTSRESRIDSAARGSANISCPGSLYAEGSRCTP